MAWIITQTGDLSNGDELFFGPEFSSGYTLVCASGTFTLSGQNTNFYKQSIITLASGEFALSGSNVVLRAARYLALAGGTFTVVGADINIVPGSSSEGLILYGTILNPTITGVIIAPTLTATILE